MKKLTTIILLLLLSLLLVPKASALQNDTGGTNIAWHVKEDDTYYVHYRSMTRDLSFNAKEKTTGFTGMDNITYKNWNENYFVHTNYRQPITISKPNETHKTLVIRTFTFDIQIDDNGTAIYTANEPQVSYKNIADAISLSYEQKDNYFTWVIKSKGIEIFSLGNSTTNFEISFIAEDEWSKKQTDGYQYFNVPYYSGSNVKTSAYIAEDEFMEIKNFDNGEYSQALDSNGNIAKMFTIEYILDDSFVDIIIDFGGRKMTTSILVDYLTNNPNYIKDVLSIRKIVDLNDIPDDAINTIEDLPATGAPTLANDISNLGNVFFTYQDKTLIVTIHFKKVYRLKYQMHADTDMSLFDTIEALYQNVDGSKPQIFINNTKDRQYLKDILKAKDDKPAFVPHTIWDLKTDTLKNVSTYNAYAYIKHNDKSALVAYFYTDEFIMDKIISANLTYTWRQKGNWFSDLIATNPYKEWQNETWTYNNTDNLSYKNITFDWQNLVPIWNIIVLGHRASTTYEMPRIEAVNFDNTQSYYNVTRNEIDSYFTNQYEDFKGMKQSSRYKLWAFALQQGKTASFAKTEVYNNPDNLDDPLNFKVLEIRYETDGKLYTTVGGDMKIHTGGPGTNQPTEISKTTIIIIVVLTIITIVSYFGALSKNKYKNVLKITLIYLAVIAVVIFLYFAITTGFINQFLIFLRL